MNKEKEDITFLDLVREYKPDATIEEADFILWERTCFPFGTLDMIKKDLEGIFLSHNNSKQE